MGKRKRTESTDKTPLGVTDEQLARVIANMMKKQKVDLDEEVEEKILEPEPKIIENPSDIDLEDTKKKIISILTDVMSPDYSVKTTGYTQDLEAPIFECTYTIPFPNSVSFESVARINTLKGVVRVSVCALKQNAIGVKVLLSVDPALESSYAHKELISYDNKKEVDVSSLKVAVNLDKSLFKILSKNLDLDFDHEGNGYRTKKMIKGNDILTLVHVLKGPVTFAQMNRLKQHPVIVNLGFQVLSNTNRLAARFELFNMS